MSNAEIVAVVVANITYITLCTMQVHMLSYSAPLEKRLSSEDGRCTGGGFDFWERGQNDHRGGGKLPILTEN